MDDLGNSALFLALCLVGSAAVVALWAWWDGRREE